MTTAAEAMNLTVTRKALPPSTAETGKPAPPDSGLWGDGWAKEPTPGGGNSGGGRGRGRQRKELPPLRSLADRRRPPTGKPSHPRILVSGSDHSGKSYELAKLTGDPRLGHAYWLEIGRESTADWYGAVPGADYELIEHDGTWRDITTALAQVVEDAKARVAAGDDDGKPPVLNIDSMSGEWELLTRIAYARAAASQAAIEELLVDPNAEIKIGPDRWNPINEKHKGFMALIGAFPGPVLLTGRGRMTLGVNEHSGNLDYNGPKVYNVAVQKDLFFEVGMHIRLDSVRPPEILGFRHPTHSVGGKNSRVKSLVLAPDHPRFEKEEFSLSWLLFTAMQYDPAQCGMQRPNDPPPDPEDEAAQDRPLPVARRLAPGMPGADESPDQAVAGTTEPQQTR